MTKHLTTAIVLLLAAFAAFAAVPAGNGPVQYPANAGQLQGSWYAEPTGYYITLSFSGVDFSYELFDTLNKKVTESCRGTFYLDNGRIRFCPASGRLYSLDNTYVRWDSPANYTLYIGNQPFYRKH